MRGELEESPQLAVERPAEPEARQLPDPQAADPPRVIVFVARDQPPEREIVLVARVLEEGQRARPAARLDPFELGEQAPQIARELRGGCRRAIGRRPTDRPAAA